jgi:hypothetical protein
VLTPKAAESTVDHVTLAVDAETGLPLQVAVLAKGQKSPALQLAFTSISFSRPAGPFTFTPPSGARVVVNPDGRAALGLAPTGGWYGYAPNAQVRGGVTQGRVYTVRPSPPAVTFASNQPTKVVGEDWTQVVIAGNADIPWQAHDLLRAATAVSGPWGTGRLIETTLVNVIVLTDGRVAAGFVTPSALEAAIAHG